MKKLFGKLRKDSPSLEQVVDTQNAATAETAAEDYNEYSQYSAEEVGKIILENKKKKQRVSIFASKKVRKWVWAIIRFVLIAGLSFVILYPLIRRVSISFMTVKDVFDQSVNLIPREGTLENYTKFIDYIKYPTALLYTVARSAVAGFLQAASCLLIGYGFARFKFKGRGLIFALIIFTMVIPPQVYIMAMFFRFMYFNPLYMFSFNFDGSGTFNLIALSSTIFSQGVPSIAAFFLDNMPLFLLSIFGVGFRNGLFIYMFRQYFRGVPKELEEAAYIDGAGFWKTFTKVMLPGTVPMFVTIFLFGFVWTYNDVIFTQKMNTAESQKQIMAIIINQAPDQLQQSLAGASSAENPLGQIYKSVAACLHLAPLIILYLFCQRFFIQSIERSGLVG